jgi:hypothetical protein
MGQGSIGARLHNEGTIALSGNSSFTEDVSNWPDATIAISGGAIATFFEDVANEAGAKISISENSAAVFFGSLVGSGSITGTGTSYIEGDLRPGLSPGLIEFGGDVKYGAFASFEVELAGRELASEFDAVHIGGAASLDGTIQVTLLDGFSPAPGDMFEVIRADGGISGSFATELLPALSDGLEFELLYNPGSVVLSVVTSAGLPGDYNDDGTVDARDYVLWRKNDGTQADYDAWRANYGRTAAGAGAAALHDAESGSPAVPEPITCLMGVVAIAILAPIVRQGRVKFHQPT